MLLTLLFACGTTTVPDPGREPTVLPNGASLPTIEGEQVLSKKSSAIIGLMKVKGDTLDQTIGWGRSKRTHQESAEHERGLVYEALGREGSGDLVTVEVAGQPASQWAVDGGATQFMGASFDLCGQRIALVTFGASAEEVAAAHAQTLAGAVCAER